METKKIAIYSRKSKFVDKSESTDNQINICKNYCTANYLLNMSFEVYEDEGFSGKNDKRPEYQRLLKDLLDKKIDVVICYKLDRISRNVSDFNTLIELLNKLNIDFISVNEKFDTSHAMGRAMMSITAVFAQLERETIGQRIKDNLVELSKSGRFINNKAPFGFTKITNCYTDKNNKQKKFNSLIINNDEINIVKLTFTKYLEFESINKVKSFLLEQNIKTRNNNAFSNVAIKRLLTNYFYCEANEDCYLYLLKNNVKYISDKTNWTGEYGVSIYRKSQNNFSDSIFTVGTHDPIINSRTFIKIQELIKGRCSKTVRREKSTTLLTGIIKCKNCGSYLRPQSFQKNGSFYYVCELKEKSKRTKCTANNIRGDIFEKELIELLITKKASLLKLEETNNVKIEDIKLLNTNKIKHKIDALVLQLTTTDDAIAKKYIINCINELHNELEKSKKENKNNNNIDSFYKNRALIRSIIKEILWNGEFFEVFFL